MTAIERSFAVYLYACAVCSSTPNNPANGVFACETNSLPAVTCNASCAEGYKASDMGYPSTTCGADGSWGEVTGGCEQIGKYAACPGQCLRLTVLLLCIAGQVTKH